MSVTGARGERVDCSCWGGELLGSDHNQCSQEKDADERNRAKESEDKVGEYDDLVRFQSEGHSDPVSARARKL